jgi:hypothetical protein
MKLLPSFFHRRVHYSFVVVIFSIFSLGVLLETYHLNKRYELQLSAFASATTNNSYYVSNSGSDSNPGSEILPFLTINKGVSVLAPGDTLLVKPGTYSETLSANIPSGTDWNSPVTLKAYDSNNKPIIVPPSGKDRVIFFSTVNGVGQHHIIINGFVLDGTNIGYDVVKITYSGTDDSKAAHHIRIMNSELKNAPKQGILTSGSTAQNNEFISLNIHNNGTTNQHHGLYIATSNNLIEKSAIHDNSGYGVHVYNEDTWNDDNNVVRGNTIYNNATGGNYGAGIILSSGTGHLAYNNIIYNNAIGIQIDYGAIGAKVYNNTLYKNDRNYSTSSIPANIDLEPSANPGNGVVGSGNEVTNNIISDHRHYGIYNAMTGTQIKNNLLYNNTDGAIRLGSATSAGNTTNSNPVFVNTLGYDFHLQPSSPAIDQGLTITSLLTDYENVTRPQGTGYDIGAYEYTQILTPSITGIVTPIPTPTTIPVQGENPELTPTLTPAFDAAAPTVAITSLVSGSLIPRNTTITLSANATDNVSVTKVEFLVNGSLKCTDTSNPYTCSWKVPASKNSTYTITARAYDATGNVGSQAVIVKSN